MPPPDCPFCGKQNPPSAKFCNECGSPLHLTPCGDCGAVNNLAEAHCWRCGSVLLPLDAPVDAPPAHVAPEPGPAVPRPQPGPEATAPPRRQAELDLTLPLELPSQEELEQELVALEQEVRDLGAPPPAAARQRPPDPLRAAGRVRRPAPLPVLRELVVAPSARPNRPLAAAAMAGVVVLGVAVGTYLYTLGQGPAASRSAAAPAPVQAAAPTASGVVRDAGEPPAVRPAPAAGPAPKATVPPASPPPAPRKATAAPEPRVVQEVRGGAATPPAPAPQASATPTPLPPEQAISPKEPRVVREVQEAAAGLSQPKALDAPVERRLASDGGEAPHTPAGAADANCPPAVAAMALCEWAAGAKRP